MAITFNESGMNVQPTKRVSIKDYDKIPAKYAEKLEQSAGVVERYASANKEKVVFTPVGPKSDMLLVTVMKDNKKPFVASEGFAKCVDTDIPFLRKVYKKIQSLTTGVTETSLEKMQAETLAKLKKIGKIK